MRCPPAMRQVLRPLQQSLDLEGNSPFPSSHPTNMFYGAAFGSPQKPGRIIGPKGCGCTDVSKLWVFTSTRVSQLKHLCKSTSTTGKCSSWCWPRTELEKVPWGSVPHCPLGQCGGMCYPKQHCDAIGISKRTAGRLNQPSLATSSAAGAHILNYFASRNLRSKGIPSSHSLTFPAIHLSQLS